MIVKEITAERFALYCRGCGHNWSEDYQIHHVQDGYGHESDYYFYDGLPSLNPCAERLICPSCRRAAVVAHPEGRVPAPNSDEAAASVTYPRRSRGVPGDPAYPVAETWLRVVTYRAEEPQEQGIADYIRATGRGVVAMLEGMPGFQVGYWGEDPTTGTVTALSYWDSLDAIEAALPTLERLQTERARHGVIVQNATNIRLLDPAAEVIAASAAPARARVG